MCRGTTNMLDVYLISVNHLPQSQRDKLASARWIGNHGGIPVDRCIGKEIEKLINLGVITLGCCCGHGKMYPSALVAEESREVLEKLGYKLDEYTENHTKQGIYEIYLKG